MIHFKPRQFAKAAGALLEKNAPEFLMITGLTGMVMAVISAVEETPRALQIVEDHKKELEKEELTKTEVVKMTWKCYVPSAIIFTLSAACIISGDRIRLKRSAALAAVCKIAENTLTDYKKAAVETVGEKKESQIQERFIDNRLKENPPRDSSVIFTGKGSSLCCDAIYNQHFNSDVESIRTAVNNINEYMLNHDHASLNDFYDELNIPHIQVGDEIGWDILKDGQLRVDFKAKILPDGRPCVVMQYMVPPHYGFDRYG